MIDPAQEDPAAFVSEMEAKARRIETPCGDGTMVWRVWGEGEPLVLTHGAQGAWSHWIRNISSLSRHRQVIAADLPGHGDSAMPASADHEGMSAALAAGLWEIAGERPVDVAGFSFGGVVAASFAARHPLFVRRLILIGCGGLSMPHGDIRVGRVAGLQGEARKAALKANLLGLMLHHPDSADDLALHLLVANARKTRLADVHHMVVPDRLLRVLPRVRVRVDALWGEFDRPHPDPALQEAAIRRSHPECDFRVISGAGHWAMYERAAAFNAALLDMLGAAQAESN